MSIGRTFLLFAFTLTTLISVAAPATQLPARKVIIDSETQKVLDEVQQRYARLKNWEAKFSQETFSVGLGQGTFSRGDLKFVAPNRFVYSIQFPEASEFISNGTEAWQVLYRKGRDKPAFVRHFKSVNETGIEKYLLVFRGRNKKARGAFKDFDFRGKLNGGNLMLELTPREASEEMASIVLHFLVGKDAPVRAIITDALQNTTTITIDSFSTLKSSIDPNWFVPKIPKDSEKEEL